MTNPIMTPAEIDMLLSKAYKLAFEAKLLMQSAEAARSDALTSTKLSDNKRKTYFREARRDYKRAAELYCEARNTLQAFLNNCPQAVKLGLWNEIPAAWGNRARECSLAAKV
jgi:hypothetical protein